MADFALQLFDFLGLHAKFLARQVAMHRNRPASAHAPEVAQSGHLARALGPDQEIDLAALAEFGGRRVGLGQADRTAL